MASYQREYEDECKENRRLKAILRECREVLSTIREGELKCLDTCTYQGPCLETSCDVAQLVKKLEGE